MSSFNEAHEGDLVLASWVMVRRCKAKHLGCANNTKVILSVQIAKSHGVQVQTTIPGSVPDDLNSSHARDRDITQF